MEVNIANIIKLNAENKTTHSWGFDMKQYTTISVSLLLQSLQKTYKLTILIAIIAKHNYVI
jgi:hypothetical protein